MEKGADINIIDNEGVRVGVCITDCVLVLLTIGYDVHDYVTNPQKSFKLDTLLESQVSLPANQAANLPIVLVMSTCIHTMCGT